MLKPSIPRPDVVVECSRLCYAGSKAFLGYYTMSLGGCELRTGIDSAKVAIYIRWSTDDQGEGTTLDVQRDACVHHAKGQGWTVPPHNIYVDDGCSGGSLDRPAMTRLRKEIQRGEIECVVTYAIDRISRNIVDAVQLVLEEWDGVCYLACVRQPIDTRSESGRLFFTQLASFADFERSQIKNRTFSGKVRRASEGRNPGITPPYGYKRGSTAGSVVVDEHRAGVIQEIFAMYARGSGMARITRWLNEQGVPTVSGKPWGHASVQKILNNEAYLGVLVYGRTRKNERRRRDPNAPERVANADPLARVEGAFAPIIDRELWDKVQALKSERSGVVQERFSPRSISSKHLLTGLLRCRCGRPMVAIKTTDYYYGCGRRLDLGLSACRNGFHRVAILEEAVLRHVRKLQDPEYQTLASQHLATALETERMQLELQIAECERRIKQCDVEELRIDRDYRSGVIEAPKYKRLSSQIETDRALASAERQKASAQLTSGQEMSSQFDSYRETVAQLALWDTLNIIERKHLLRRLISKLTVYREKGSKDDLELVIEFWRPGNDHS